MKTQDQVTVVLEAAKVYLDSDMSHSPAAALRRALVLNGCRKPVTEFSGPVLLAIATMHLMEASKGLRADVIEFAMELGQRPGYEPIMDRLLMSAYGS